MSLVSSLRITRPKTAHLGKYIGPCGPWKIDRCSCETFRKPFSLPWLRTLIYSPKMLQFLVFYFRNCEPQQTKIWVPLRKENRIWENLQRDRKGLWLKENLTTDVGKLSLFSGISTVGNRNLRKRILTSRFLSSFFIFNKQMCVVV